MRIHDGSHHVRSDALIRVAEASGFEDYGFLSAQARRLGVSTAGVVRRIVEERMAKGQKPDPFADLVGAGAGDGHFSGADHDRVLYGDPGE